MKITRETYINAGVDLSDTSQWQPLLEFHKDNKKFSIDQIRRMAKLRDYNGLAPICKKIGDSKKLYIHRAGFGVFIANC